MSSPSAEPTDQALVAAANRGSAQAMEALYARYGPWVYGQALRICGQEADAADATQEVFAYLFARFPGFTLTCRMKTFLYPVVRHTALRIKRRRSRAVPLSEGAPDTVPDPGVSPEADHFALSDLVAALPAHERELVLLRFEESRTLPEIAERLGLPLPTVKSRLYKALDDLRRRLGAGE